MTYLSLSEGRGPNGDRKLKLSTSCQAIVLVREQINGHTLFRAKTLFPLPYDK